MARLDTSREVWHPRTRLDREAVLKHMQEVLTSTQFCNSKRYPALLQYIVEKTLDGQADALKERTLGVEVFDRPPSYDTNAIPLFATQLERSASGHRFTIMSFTRNRKSRSPSR
jgi:hypothetical protein